MQVVCKTLCKTWKARSCPLYLTLALPPPLQFFFFFFFFCFKKNLMRLKINILSSIYPEINFPAEPLMKINNLSRPKVPAPPPPPSASNGRPLIMLHLVIVTVLITLRVSTEICRLGEWHMYSLCLLKCRLSVVKFFPRESRTFCRLETLACQLCHLQCTCFSNQGPASRHKTKNLYLRFPFLWL